jgi:hypothetical protein
MFMSDPVPADLVRHVAASTGLAPTTAARVVADVIAYFGESAEDFVRRRHAELQRLDKRNAEIWAVVAGELRSRPVAAADLSERQLRRIVYG